MRLLGELEPITYGILAQELTTRPTNMLIASFACLSFRTEGRINKQILSYQKKKQTNSFSSSIQNYNYQHIFADM